MGASTDSIPDVHFALTVFVDDKSCLALGNGNPMLNKALQAVFESAQEPQRVWAPPPLPITAIWLSMSPYGSPSPISPHTPRMSPPMPIRGSGHPYPPGITKRAS